MKEARGLVMDEVFDYNAFASNFISKAWHPQLEG